MDNRHCYLPHFTNQHFLKMVIKDKDFWYKCMLAAAYIALIVILILLS
jgi:hypothetical protein